ncbi:MAG: spore maturation protein [Alphaproteobacteria bacterium]|nr:spore maturation protein [Alphaproteobacteria bacterium]
MMQILSAALLPLLIGVIVAHGAYRRVPLWTTFVAGAKSGAALGVRIMPYLIVMLTAVGLFRASGLMALLTDGLAPVLSACGIAPELIPLALMRSFSGSGTLALFSDIVATHGADSALAKTAALMTGSSETTFYVLSVYFGAVGVTKYRHAVIAGLAADLTGIVMALVMAKLLWS